MTVFIEALGAQSRCHGGVRPLVTTRRLGSDTTPHGETTHRRRGIASSASDSRSRDTLPASRTCARQCRNWACTPSDPPSGGDRHTADNRSRGFSWLRASDHVFGFAVGVLLALVSSVANQTGLGRLRRGHQLVQRVHGEQDDANPHPKEESYSELQVAERRGDCLSSFTAVLPVPRVLPDEDRRTRSLSRFLALVAARPRTERR